MAVPPDFVAGQVLTAAQMNAIGLWEIKSQTIGNAVSSITVSDAFTADYDNYLITVNGGVASTTNYLNITMGTTATGYYLAGIEAPYGGGGVTAYGWSNGNNLEYSVAGSTDDLQGAIWVFQPQLARRTMFQYASSQTVTTNRFRLIGGYLNNTTQYTSFVMTTNTGTVTGGTIRVYGMRK